MIATSTLIKSNNKLQRRNKLTSKLIDPSTCQAKVESAEDSPEEFDFSSFIMNTISNLGLDFVSKYFADTAAGFAKDILGKNCRSKDSIITAYRKILSCEAEKNKMDQLAKEAKIKEIINNAFSEADKLSLEKLNNYDKCIKSNELLFSYALKIKYGDEEQNYKALVQAERYTAWEEVVRGHQMGIARRYHHIVYEHYLNHKEPTEDDKQFAERLSNQSNFDGLKLTVLKELKDGYHGAADKRGELDKAKAICDLIPKNQKLDNAEKASFTKKVMAFAQAFAYWMKQCEVTSNIKSFLEGNFWDEVMTKVYQYLPLVLGLSLNMLKGIVTAAKVIKALYNAVTLWKEGKKKESSGELGTAVGLTFNFILSTFGFLRKKLK